MTPTNSAPQSKTTGRALDRSFTIRLSSADLHEIEALAAAEERPIASALRRLVRRGLEGQTRRKAA